MKHIAEQFELPNVEGGFKLISETTLDGERIARENKQREQARAESGALQIEMFQA